jgi:hypothetical protein
LAFLAAFTASSAFVTASRGECVRDTETNVTFSNFAVCAGLGAAGWLILHGKDWDKATKAERDQAWAECGTATNWVQRAYGLTEDDIETLTRRRTADYPEPRSLLGRMFPQGDEDYQFPAANVFHCTDGQRRMLVRLRTWLWLQFPERFARTTTWYGGPPSAPETGHPANWAPDDLMVINDDTRQGDLEPLPPGTVVRSKYGKAYRLP